MHAALHLFTVFAASPDPILDSPNWTAEGRLVYGGLAMQQIPLYINKCTRYRCQCFCLFLVCLLLPLRSKPNFVQKLN